MSSGQPEGSCVRSESEEAHLREPHGEETVPLLRDQASKKPTPLPKLQVAALMLLFLPEGVTSTLIYPFVVQLVRSLNIVKGDPASVGYYSGLIESCFFFTEAMFIFFWARTSDKVGRKPVLLIGSLGLAIAVTCFGFSTSLFGVMASRMLQGALNGNMGVVRAMLSEVTDSSNRAQAFAFAPIMWATGSTLGPLVGGILANPADRFPVFNNWFWHNHKFLLPCLAAGLLSLTAFTSTALFIKETLHTRAGLFSRITGTNPTPAPTPAPVTTVTSYGAVENTPESESVPAPAKEEDLSLSALFTPRLVSVLVNNALLAVLDHGFVALNAVFLATPITSGGLGLVPSQIGLILGATGLVHGVLQMICFAPLYRIFDPKRLYTSCMVSIVLSYACFPIINAMARSGGLAQPGLWVLVVFQLLLLFPTYTAFSVMFIFISNAAPSPALLGTTNGVAGTLFAAMGAIGPASVTSLFAVSIERNLLGGHLIYVVMCSLAVIAVLASIYYLPERPGDEVATPGAEASRET